MHDLLVLLEGLAKSPCATRRPSTRHSFEEQCWELLGIYLEDSVALMDELRAVYGGRAEQHQKLVG